ncbi:CPBP family intramembrane glutamic endopeptidase [Microbacterium sp.]|uniref:CPBP family intramembrane glutamic endopeptidase n=1 Tax=Microbacterium sp. TaxID=51671 RepID=UPI002E37B754|nr:CPBP family intramembrane glutamic endopeptidase [Microbacterium sp.]HEX5728932.1 CPBP family intramembrane glutamic endopeptidase [Microbacterium sp.]
MTTPVPQHPHRIARRSDSAAPARNLLVYASVAVLSGWVLLGAAVALNLPMEVFLLAVNFLGLLLPAILLTWREGGGVAVRRLLRDAVRLPVHWWWLPVAGLGLPAVVWSFSAALGAAQPLTLAVLSGFAVQLLSSWLIINIWEETGWTGYFQRRAMVRWGTIGGSLLTALLFAAIHLPLAFAGGNVLVNIASLLIAGVGLRLLIAGVDGWTGGSLLTVGLLHASFNATPALIDPSHDWIRLAVTLVAGLAVALVLRRRRGEA